MIRSLTPEAIEALKLKVEELTFHSAQRWSGYGKTLDDIGPIVEREVMRTMDVSSAPLDESARETYLSVARRQMESTLAMWLASKRAGETPGLKPRDDSASQ